MTSSAFIVTYGSSWEARSRVAAGSSSSRFSSLRRCSALMARTLLVSGRARHSLHAATAPGMSTRATEFSVGSIESFLRAYEQASATTVDRVVFHWWLVLATLRWGVICRYQAERHLSGQFRSVELAAIGRRVCETEWDLLDLLEEVRP